MSIKDGHLHVAMDLGSGSFSEKADIPGYTLDDGQWHQVEIRRNARQVSCPVDLPLLVCCLPMIFYLKL